MSTHPVQLEISAPPPRDRMQVLIRVVLLAAIGSLGWSSLYWLLYWLLPATIALAVAQKEPKRFLTEDAPRIVRVLTWLAAADAYLCLLTDAFPKPAEDPGVRLRIETAPAPTVSSALFRWIYSIPAVLLFALMSIAAAVVWMIGATSILLVQRLPEGVHRFLALVMRYQFRLAAYHLSLVDEYPSFDEAHAPSLPLRGRLNRGDGDAA